MKHFVMMLIVGLSMAVFSGSVLGATVKTAKAMPMEAEQLLPQLTGSVVSITPGEKFQIEEKSGRVRTLYISKKTKIRGELKLGKKVSVTTSGRWARDVSVESPLATR